MPKGSREQADPLGPLAVARVISYDSQVISAQCISPFLPYPPDPFSSAIYILSGKMLDPFTIVH